MTVEELIDRLKELPQDATVLVVDNDNGENYADELQNVTFVGHEYPIIIWEDNLEIPAYMGQDRRMGVIIA